MALVIGVPLLIAAAVLVRVFEPLDPASVREWADAHALRLSDVNRPMVEHYLRTARRLRGLGAVAGVILVPLVGWAIGVDASRAGLLWILPGYLVGAFYAEVALGRPLGTARAALLTPREVHDYVPRRVLIAQRVLGVGCAASALVVLALPASDAISPEPPALAASLIGAALAIALEVLERHVVRRPQPVTVPDLVAADDAIRSQSIHAIAGSGMAMLMLCLAPAAFVVSAGLPRPFTVPALLLVFVAGWVGPLVAWLYWGHRAWRVRRPNRAQVPA